MNNIVITELSLPVRLFRSGLLRYFNGGELVFFITDLSYENRTISVNNDKIFAKKMIDQGLLKVIDLDEWQMRRVENLYNAYKPKFIFKTISGLVLAQNTNFKLVSEDEILIETASQDLGIRAYNKEWLLIDIMSEVSLIGNGIDINLLKELI